MDSLTYHYHFYLGDGHLTINLDYEPSPDLGRLLRVMTNAVKLAEGRVTVVRDNPTEIEL